MPKQQRRTSIHRLLGDQIQVRLGRPPPPSSASVSRVMKSNRGRDTLPERLLLSCLRALGAPAFILHQNQLRGTPDIVFSRGRTVVFVNGCFWHACRRCSLPTPKTHSAYWRQKIEINVKRDREVRRELTREGWRVITVWECEVKRDPMAIGRRILTKVRSSAPLMPHTHTPLSRLS